MSYTNSSSTVEDKKVNFKKWWLRIKSRNEGCNSVDGDDVKVTPIQYKRLELFFLIREGCFLLMSYTREYGGRCI